MRVFLVKATLIILLFASSLHAQQAPELPAPQKEHEWLKQLVGEWETESEALMGPGQPAMKCKGTIQSKMLGGYWVLSEMKMEMMGTPIAAVQSIGYDPQLKKYVGTWIDSMTSTLWKYEGSVDATGKILTLEAEGPSFVQPGKLAKFRDIYEFKSPQHVAVSSMMQGEDGKWVTFMKGNSKRKASAK